MNQIEYLNQQELLFLSKLSELGFSYQNYQDFIKDFLDENIEYENDDNKQAILKLVRDFGELFSIGTQKNENFLNININYVDKILYSINLGIKPEAFNFSYLQQSANAIKMCFVSRFAFATNEILDAILNGDNDFISHQKAKEEFIKSFTLMKSNETIKGNVLLLIKIIGEEETENLLRICDCLSVKEILENTEDFPSENEFEKIFLDLD